MTEDSRQNVSQTQNPTEAEHEDAGGEPTLQSTSSKEFDIEELNSAPTVPQAQSPHSSTASATESKVPTPIKRGTMSVNPIKKANGGPPTPTVKKIISSGTFGAGSVKPTGAKTIPTTTSAPSKAAAPALRKTDTPTSVSKPTMSSSTSAKPPVAPAVPGRRASVVPARTAPLPVKPSLSASTNAKSPPETIRSSVASPTGSVGSSKAVPVVRPRASVSEAVKKAPLSSRPTPATSTRSAVPARTSTLSRSSAGAAPPKLLRTASSISSIQEVKEDGKVVAELQNQLEEASKALEAKEAAVSALENRQEALETALAEAESKAANVLESETAKAATKLQLQETQDELKRIQEELKTLRKSSESVQKELEDTKTSSVAQKKVAEQLQARIHELEAAISSLKEQAQVLEKDGVEAASMEHEALLKAQADFKAVSEEAEALKVAHTKAIQDCGSHIAELREKAAAAETLQAQLTSLKAERGDNANKLSELEIEILELKETQDGLEDSKESLQKQIATLEDELANAAVATGLVAELTSQKESKYEQKIEDLLAKHQQELETEAGRYAAIVASIDALKVQHSDAIAAHKQSQTEFIDKERNLNSKLAEVEEAHAAKQTTLSEEIDKISKELQSQQAIYDAKVDVVKAEHTQLLQAAFERAKNEAADAHSRELQAFRSSSNATIEEIKLSNKVALHSLKVDHESLLETEVNSLQKQISKLNLELKATQDDLTKAKSSLESSHSEIDALTKQRDSARAQLEAAPTLSPQHADEISHLTKELANTKDDLAAVTEMLNLAKNSMVELSANHKKELEGAAQGRAEEVLKLRAVHDAEVSTFANQKSELLVRLSDLEGELATASAALQAQRIASPKSNGSPHTTSVGVTKEELTKMHEAHNLKIYDIQAEHEKAMKHKKEELDEALTKVNQLQQDIARKAMEIQYMEQDQEESQDQITRLKEDLRTFTEKLDYSDKS